MNLWDINEDAFFMPKIVIFESDINLNLSIAIHFNSSLRDSYYVKTLRNSVTLIRASIKTYYNGHILLKVTKNNMLAISKFENILRIK